MPGVGAQGGEIDPVLRDGPVTGGPAGSWPGRALLVNVSRGITGAAAGARDPGESMAAAAREWAARLPVLP